MSRFLEQLQAEPVLGDGGYFLELERRVVEAIGFKRAVPVSGQTYPRKIDWMIHQALSGIAQSAAKFGTDVRLLSHERELGEPREAKQIGSSAMAYKHNPMRSERICSLARYVCAAAETSAQTAAHQWLERTLDDSAVRRIRADRRSIWPFTNAWSYWSTSGSWRWGVTPWPSSTAIQLGSANRS